MARPARVRRAVRSRLAGAAWPRTRRSWQALLIALGLLLAQGPQLFHLLLVPHATCEHGDLVEGARAAAGADGGAAARSPDRPQIERAHPGSDSHDHCDALAVRHRLPDMDAPVAEASLLWIAPIEEGGAGAEARPVPLLSLAPKVSPPSA